MMKKLLTGILTAAVVLSMGTASAFAAGFSLHGGHHHGLGVGTAAACAAWCDEDNDGICDGCGYGRHYVDADGDGVCDNWGSGARLGGHHGGRGCRW